MKEIKLLWIAQVIVAVVLFQTLYFKFTSQPVSVELFTQLGVEPWGRYLVGVMELITGILLLIPQTALIGAILALTIGAGAILTHLFFIGILFDGDITLFLLAIMITILSAIIIYTRRKYEKRK